jgi:hypothetical protein
MFTKKFTTKQVDLRYSNGLVKNGWVQFSIEPNYCMVYISRDINRIYWIGRHKGKVSAGFTISFNDKLSIISINTSNKIKFHNEKDYLKIKEKMMYYKLMKPDENRVVFLER